MMESIIKVDGMSCEHCVRAITKAVSALPGIGSVAVDLQAGTVTVRHDPDQSPVNKIKLAIEDQGYDVAP
ncbi:MAG: copper ion binding protein [Oscillospiraceae bacterium]|jgi:copper chaperone|nr:copper ion binding protein [Oscillospiraceae bacterium]